MIRFFSVFTYVFPCWNDQTCISRMLQLDLCIRMEQLDHIRMQHQTCVSGCKQLPQYQGQINQICVSRTSQLLQTYVGIQDGATRPVYQDGAVRPVFQYGSPIPGSAGWSKQSCELGMEQLDPSVKDRLTRSVYSECASQTQESRMQQLDLDIQEVATRHKNPRCSNQTQIARMQQLDLRIQDVATRPGYPGCSNQT